MKIWNNCRKAGYVILFAAVISMSAYIFYGAVDTLKYADALENVINGKDGSCGDVRNRPFAGYICCCDTDQGASGDGKTVFKDSGGARKSHGSGADSDSTSAADIVPPGSFENI